MAGEVRPQVQGFVSKSKIVGEFVDDFPEITAKFEKGNKTRTSWQAQPGIREALLVAFNNPRKKMKLVTYDVGSPSRRRHSAELRARSLGEQGYSEQNGWVVKSVDDSVFVCYMGD